MPATRVTDDALLEAAWTARANAYAPYSGFMVGAAVEGDDGSVHAGGNVENASYGLAICAERVAIGAAVAGGVRAIERLALVADAEPPVSPCGACRQVLAEFADDALIIAAGPRSIRRWRLRELLPDRFARVRLKAERR